MGKNKVLYYSKGFFKLLVPRWVYRRQLPKLLDEAKSIDQNALWERVNYYNKLPNSSILPGDATTVGAFRYRKKLKTYFFDLLDSLRYFPREWRFMYLFGDITTVPLAPTFVKSRPIVRGNENSVLVKLNAVRHFNFVNDTVPFQDKQDKLFGRAKVFKRQPHRERFLEMYWNHPLCNIGKINNDGRNPHWLVPKASIREHLRYKFILCLEGNDVATNLKWVMASNSIAVMPRPKYETWFMEGTLIPDYHYIAVSDDYSDLEDKLLYYIKHSDKALSIVAHAHEHVAKFVDLKAEKLVALMTVKRYFERTQK